MDLPGVENRSFPRNHQVAHIFYLSGEIEEVGSGISHMQYSLQRSGLPKPGFVLSATETFRTVLPRLEKTSRLSG
jgi:predicted HTH transcriptional regulator